MQACESPSEQLGEVFRFDAKAEGEKIVIGGWKVVDGGDTSRAAWFALTLTRSTAPWAYSRGEPFRTIAALGLLGPLVSLVVLMSELESGGTSRPSSR